MDRVVFRKWLSGGIIAILPDSDSNLGMMMMYEHTGQHGEGDYKHTLKRTSLATPEEYKGLLEELTLIGYNLRVVQRIRRD